MIPEAFIQEWRESVPWQTLEMVEQDLILSRALIDIFSDEALSNMLAFRGGTALHKLCFDQPHRYSEDIDLVQIKSGPVGPIYDGIQAVLNPWLGTPSRKRGPGVANLIYKTDSEFPPSVRLRLKVEINTREHFSVDGFLHRDFDVASRWHSGKCKLTTYSLEELLATKMRALYQRRKGRDLFDLWLGLTEGNADAVSVATTFCHYMNVEGSAVKRSDYRKNLSNKLEHPGFLGDVEPLLVENTIFDIHEAHAFIESTLVSRLPA